MTALLTRELTMVDACRQFGISRKTGYKIVARHAELGLTGLADASRAPKTHPNQSSPEVEAAVLRVRKAHPTWGSKKILATLDRERADQDWPARSTVDAILNRAGLVVPRGARQRRQPTSPPVVAAHASNDVWSMDYRGWFRVGDGTRCDPLTVNDVFSRASLVCQAMIAPKSALHAERRWSAVRLLRTRAPVAAWRMAGAHRRGPMLIEPGRPDQNGRHERFHETLKAETANPPSGSIRAQQAAFNRSQETYNQERPHEALAMKTPAEVYELSPRELPSHMPDHVYPDGFDPRSVRRDGAIKWDGEQVFVGEAFAGETVGIEPVDDGLWHVHLGPAYVRHDVARADWRPAVGASRDGPRLDRQHDDLHDIGMGRSCGPS